MITGDIEINKSFRLETDYNYSSRQVQRAIFFWHKPLDLYIFFRGTRGCHANSWDASLARKHNLLRATK